MKAQRFFSTITLGLFLFTSLSLKAADWPKFLGPLGTGITTETNLISQWAASGPKRLWRQEVGTGYSAPSIIDNQLTLHHRIGNEEIVETYEAETGLSRWRYSYPSHFVDPFGYNNGPRCSPLLTRTRCYTFGAEGKLVCLERATGKHLWTRDTAADFNIPQAFFGVGSTPILESGLLIVMVGGQPNSGIAAFDPETGKTVWSSIGKDTWDGKPKIGWRGEPPVKWKVYEMQASYASPVPATIHGKRHLLCFMRQGLVSLDPKSGKILFSFWFRSRVNESVNAINPVVKDDLVFLSAAYYGVGSVLLQVQKDGRSVKEIWRNDVLEIHWSTPILDNGYLYAFSGRNEPDARFRCVEFTTGELMWDQDQRWRKSLTPPTVYGRGSIVMADGKLFVLGEAGLLGLFKPSPEKPIELARYQVPELKYPCWAAPIISNRHLYLRSENRLICYDIASK
ncbi:PQQ-like beta-propeller repeat protein [bacterium]|jgi:outer membrane protein assembly factor BamB|nr:PQQ-binding-like beta-propeller repeat protein [Verrucomicrobiota bacterium]MDA7633346.1 PQQ-like beta-propeller repeat protein [bacterium]MDB4745615.1 PQQ-like beta-propeller repeat protein [Verrucomicrobiota bacterium]